MAKPVYPAVVNTAYKATLKQVEASLSSIYRDTRRRTGMVADCQQILVDFAAWLNASPQPLTGFLRKIGWRAMLNPKVYGLNLGRYRTQLDNIASWTLKRPGVKAEILTRVTALQTALSQG